MGVGAGAWGAIAVTAVSVDGAEGSALFADGWVRTHPMMRSANVSRRAACKYFSFIVKNIAKWRAAGKKALVRFPVFCSRRVRYTLAMCLTLVMLIWIGAILLTAIVSYLLMFRPVYRSVEYTRKYGIEHGEFPASFCELGWKPFEFRSSHGYALKGQCLEGRPDAPAILFVHGITWTRYGMAKYMQPFIERQWNVAAFDLPGHGESKAPGRYYPSYGWYERDDVGAAVEALHARFPKARAVGLVGESLGAASVLEFGPLAEGKPERRVDFIIADCPFSSAWEELVYQMHYAHIPNLVGWPAAQLIRLTARLVRGFDLKWASPAQAVLKTRLPIMFVHGMEDRYVPTMMSVQMASARLSRQEGRTKLLLVPGARHAKSFMTDPELWTREVFAFIEEVVR